MLTSGPNAGNIVTADSPGGLGVDPYHLKAGDPVYLGWFETAPASYAYFIVGRDATGPIGAVLFVLAVVVLAVAGWRGLRTIAALTISSVLLLGFLVPALLAGRNPFLVAAFGGFAVLAAATFTAHGRGVTTVTALAGASCGLTVTAALGAIVVTIWDLSVIGSEHAWLLGSSPMLGSQWLLVAGAAVSVLGAVDDLCVTQAAVVEEIRRADPDLSDIEVLRSAMRVGREHISASVNTLLLAALGTSLPALLVAAGSGSGIGVVASDSGLTAAVLGALIGTVGVIAAVPATTWLATRLTRRSWECPVGELQLPPGPATPP